MEFITKLLSDHGYIVLFVALALELIGLPTPGETLMTYCGYLVYQGQLNWLGSIVISTAGVITGISISYIIGYVIGSTFFPKYGKYIHLGPDKMSRASKRFEKYGNGILVFAYFIPGIRHITGYFSGTTKIPYKTFAINAYIGALIWAVTFISVGKIFGANWEKYLVFVERYALVGGILLAIIIVCIYLYKRKNKAVLRNKE